MDLGSDLTPRIRKFARSLAGRAALAAPGVLGLAVFALLSKPLSGAPGPLGGEAEIPPSCAGWHRGDGESRPFDLARTERGYREFKESLSQTLSKSLREAAAKAGPTGYDAGLAACRRSGKRSVTPSNPVPEQLRGRRLWFFAFTPGSRPKVPEQLRSDPDIIPLATRVEKVEDLAKLSELFGRAASLAPKGLGEALGVRCVPALVSISKEGEVVIDEDP